MADAKLGVPGRPKVGEDTLVDGCIVELGLASLEGDRPPGGRGDDDRGGGPDPTYFF